MTTAAADLPDDVDALKVMKAAAADAEVAGLKTLNARGKALAWTPRLGLSALVFGLPSSALIASSEPLDALVGCSSGPATANAPRSSSSIL